MESGGQSQEHSDDLSDHEILDSLHPLLSEWWQSRFADTENNEWFTPPQRGAIPCVNNGEHVLIAAPTGLGKTLASFAAVINDLLERDDQDALENTVYCLYISPLKSLANDIHRNLERPLAGIDDIRTDQGAEPVGIRHAIRHGDTDQSTRQAMLSDTPHILNTTPETLAILLNAPKFREKLRSVEYVIVDEIHSIADNKRGSHLAVSLERLEALAEQSPVRIGCSATVEPIETIADFLVGCDTEGSIRERTIVDRRDTREYDLQLSCPVPNLIETSVFDVRDQMYETLHRLIRTHTNTIVFTNSRSGAERVLHELRERFLHYTRDNSGCHHGSLSESERRRVETGLKAGDMEVVVTSTSLELGIDMPYVDLVVQIGSPKSIAALLQRIGRAGHRPGEVVKGRVLVLERDELLECAAMLECAADGFVDRVSIPMHPWDVGIQHIYGMAISAVRPEQEVRSILEAAYPFRDLTDATWERLIRYLTAEHVGLEDRNIYAKIWRDRNDPPDGEHHHEEFPVGTPLIGKRGRLARVIYLTNIGTIPDSFSCDVFTRADHEWVGSLDEEYLDTLAPGDVFLLGGSSFAYRYRRGGNVYVDPTSDRPTVPSWYSERLPLSYDLGCAVLSLQRRLVDGYTAGGQETIRSVLSQCSLDSNATSSIVRMVEEQLAYVGTKGISTPTRLVIEEERNREAYQRRYYVHSRYGRAFNDGLSRILAEACARTASANVSVSVTDGGFTLAMPLNRKVDLIGILTDLDPSSLRDTLRKALRETELLKRYFRINAIRSLMILTRYKGYEKSAKEQQVSSEMLLGYAHDLDEFVVLEETYRELLEDRLAIAQIETCLTAIHRGELDVTHIRVGSPSPFAFGLATLSTSDVVVAADQNEVVQDFHRRVIAAINDEELDQEISSTAME